MITVRTADGFAAINRGHAVTVTRTPTGWNTAVSGMPMPGTAATMGTAFRAADAYIDTIPHQHSGYRTNTVTYPCCGSH